MSFRLLFIGNSYTFYNDMPAQACSVLSELGEEASEERQVAGGSTLKSHWERGAATKRIVEGAFSHVVIQEKSTGPLHDRGEFDDYGERFIRVASDAGATPLLYLTWARALGHTVYQSGWSGGDPQTMLERLTEAYASLGAKTGSDVVPVGPIWEAALSEDATLPLYDADLHHAAALGGHLTALAFAAFLSQKPVSPTAMLPDDVSEEQGRQIRREVDRYYANRIGAH